MTRLVVVGDVLLDRDIDGHADRLCPDAPAPVVDEPVETSRPGGAGLAALLAARDGHEVVLVTAMGRDEAGDELRDLLDAEGMQVVDLGHDGATPEKVRIRADGRSLVRLDHGGRRAGRIGPLAGAAVDALRGATGALVADYGYGVAAQPDVRDALAARRGGLPLVWDPHPRGAEPVPGCALVTPNCGEAALFAGGDEPEATLSGVTARAQRLRKRWSAAAVAVTLGDRGALLVQGDGLPLVQPARQVPCFDPCGAGDRFASAAAGLLADGALPSEAVAGAVEAATAFIAAGGAAAIRGGQGLRSGAAPYPSSGEESAYEVVARVRAQGGTVVATGGCFDLLHAGHTAVLQAARALGDCLVVCLNSDESVRRLKGAGRPLQRQQDRAAMLRALSCVDAVVVFDEDTPVTALERLRPDVWAKGGDYALTDLPESTVLSRWGGQAVVLPYLEGRSTTRLIRGARSSDDPLAKGAPARGA
ncbi:MAG: D-glycero-beta-D-manno-heptose 1-phosphate adenylyltransferase [Frankiaceae bacterium]